MGTLELDAKKAQLVRIILNDIDSVDILEKIGAYLSAINIKPTEPCDFTFEEIKVIVDQGERDFEEGLGCPHEQMKRKHFPCK